MFFGQFEHIIDAKGRLTIPSNFRDMLPDGIFVMQGFDGNLTVYPKEHFEHIAANTGKMSITDSDTRLLRRFLFSKTVKLEFDSAGRILLPSYLREFAHLDSNVVIIGAYDNFEIWSPELWHKQEELMNDPQANASRWDALDVSAKWE